MSKNIILIIIVVAILIVGVGFVVFRGSNQTSAPPNAPNVPNTPGISGPSSNLDKLPDLSFKDYTGKTIALADFKGKSLVVNTWASWCPFCREELPDFATAQKEFGDKVVIIAIDRAEPLETAKRYSDELGVTNNLILLLDPRDSFYQAIGGFSMPETLFVDKDGNIREHKRGPIKLSEMRQKINALLQS